MERLFRVREFPECASLTFDRPRLLLLCEIMRKHFFYFMKPLPHFQKTGVLCFLTMVLMAVPLCQADLLVEDVVQTEFGEYVFDGEVTDNRIHGKKPASTVGFTGAWRGSNALSLGVSEVNVEFPGIRNSGGSFAPTFLGGYSRMIYRRLSPPLSESDLWFSTLVQPNQAALNNKNGTATLMCFLSGVPPTNTDPSTHASWYDENGGDLYGFGWGVANGELVVDLQEDAGGAGRVGRHILLEGGAVMGDTPYLLVAHLQRGAGGEDHLQVWVTTGPLPSDESALGAPALDLKSRIFAANEPIANLVLYFSAMKGSPRASVHFDAVRVGDSLASVLPAAE